MGVRVALSPLCNMTNPLLKTCSRCGNPSRKSLCNSCSVRKTRKRKLGILREILGDSCCICGYGGELYIPILEMHHVHPEQMLFRINEGALGKPLDVVMAEAHKCIQVCQNCHAECHAGIIPLQKAVEYLFEFWKSRLPTVVRLTKIWSETKGSRRS